MGCFNIINQRHSALKKKLKEEKKKIHAVRSRAFLLLNTTLKSKLNH